MEDQLRDISALSEAAMARPRPAARHTVRDTTGISRHKARPPKLESRSKSVGAETGAESPGTRYITQKIQQSGIFLSSDPKPYIVYIF